MLARSDAHRHENETDILWIQNLRVAREIDENILNLSLKKKKRRAHVTEHLRAPGFADEFVVIQDAAMGLKIAACFESKNKVFVIEADQLCEVAITCNGGISHAGILLFIFHKQRN